MINCNICLFAFAYIIIIRLNSYKIFICLSISTRGSPSDGGFAVSWYLSRPSAKNPNSRFYHLINQFEIYRSNIIRVRSQFESKGVMLKSCLVSMVSKREVEIFLGVKRSIYLFVLVIYCKQLSSKSLE